MKQRTTQGNLCLFIYIYTGMLLVIVRSDQRVQTDESGEVDVVFDDHDVTGLEAVGQ